MNQTWLLFEDGSYYSVFCTPYPMPKGTSKPVDAYILTEPVGDFTIAAQKAVHAVFACAHARQLPIEPVNAGFDLAERVGHDADIAGQSGGLSFAVAFARQVLQTDTGNVAATGVIQANGRIGPVRSIQAKLNTAVELLGENDLLLFPLENLDDIPGQLLTRIRQKNIRYVPVSKMDDVLDILLGAPLRETTGFRGRGLVLPALLAAAVILAVVFLRYPTDSPVPGPQTPVRIAAVSQPAVLPEPDPQPDPKPVAEPPPPASGPDPDAALPMETAAATDAEDPGVTPVKLRRQDLMPKRRPPRPVPAVTQPLPPAGPEGDRGFE